MKRISRRYIMSLYTLKREDLISYSDYEGLPSKLEIKKLDSEMLECFKENCNGMYKEWHHALKLSGGGYCCSCAD